VEKAHKPSDSNSYGLFTFDIAVLIIIIIKMMSLCLFKHYTMKCMGEWVYRFHVLLTSALAGGEWSASRPCRFTLRERVPNTHWIRGLVDPRAGLDYKEKCKFLTPPGLEL
jgi:hypothetical protein